jgi:hypothetical protein
MQLVERLFASFWKSMVARIDNHSKVIAFVTSRKNVQERDRVFSSLDWLERKVKK